MKALLRCFTIVALLLMVFAAQAKYTERYYVNGTLSAIGFDTTSTQATNFSVATFNAGILYKFKKRSFEPTPYTDERLHLIPQALMNTTADVICIQEIYKEADKQVVIQGVKESYPYAVYYEKKRSGGAGWHSGLLVLSKFPISKSRFELYSKNALMEKMFADKGVLSVLLTVNGKDVVIANTHTTVGGGVYDTESDRVNRIRNKQVIQAYQCALSFGSDQFIVLGDFNAGPCVSEVNYQTLLDSTMVDSYLSFEKQDTTAIFTWDPLNPLNAHSYFPDSPAQRIDNIFVSPAMVQQYTIIDVQAILKEPVLTVDSISYPVSDHYGYQVTFRLR